MSRPGGGPLPDLPEAPVFDEPWQAQAFALAVYLHEAGAFTWAEWAATLSAEIHGTAERPYWAHWLAALERIVAAKGLAAPEMLAARKTAWQEAAARTPHGQPIVLRPDDGAGPTGQP